MKYLFLIFCLFCGFADADCTSSNIGVYDSKGVLVSSHTQTYKAIDAAVTLAQTNGKATIKTPDIICTTKLSSSSSSRSSSVSSNSSRSASSSSIPSNCPVTAIDPYYRVSGSTWIAGNSVTVTANQAVEFGPRPYTGSWLWSGCGTSGSAREQTVRTAASCKIVVTYTNTCGAKSTHEFTINVGSVSSAASSSRSSSAPSQVTVAWEQPTQRENGERLTESEIGGYEIRQWSSSSYRSTFVGAVTSATLPNVSGKIEIAVFDTDGLYSEFVEAK